MLIRAGARLTTPEGREDLIAGERKPVRDRLRTVRHGLRRAEETTKGQSSRLVRIESRGLLERFSMPDPMNADPDYGVDDFKAENLVAILRAVPLTDGTCSAVASKAREYGSTVLASTLDEWIQEGREDLIAGETGTAFAGSSRPSTSGRDDQRPKQPVSAHREPRLGPDIAHRCATRTVSRETRRGQSAVCCPLRAAQGTLMTRECRSETRRPHDLRLLVLAPGDVDDAAVATGPAGIGGLSIAVDVCNTRGVDPGNLLAAEPVLDQGIDELDHALRVFKAVSHEDGTHVSARHWPAGTPGRLGRRKDSSIRRQIGSRG